MTFKLLGGLALGPVEYVFNLFGMTYLALRVALVEQVRSRREISRVISAQIHFTGVEALPLITILALGSGSLVMLETTSSGGLFGGAAAAGDVMVNLVLRELAPLLTALIVIARSVTAVASEIGAMRVNRELEALESMGIHPLGYVVFPRLAGGVISVFCLSVYFVAIAALGGFALTASVHALPLDFFVDRLFEAVTARDLNLFALKNLCGGLSIFAIGCYQGLAVRRAPHEVPQMTTKAVVNCVIAVAFVNVVFTVLGRMS